MFSAINFAKSSPLQKEAAYESRHDIRSLSQTWRDVMFKQCAAGYEAGVPLPIPISYLIPIPEWKRDVRIQIPKKIELRSLRQSILAFLRATNGANPTYDGEHISTLPARTVASALEELGKNLEHRSEEKIPPGAPRIGPNDITKN